MPPIGLSQTEVSLAEEYGGDLGWCVPKITAHSDRSRGLVVGTEQLETLNKWARSRTLPARLVLRARIVLSLTAGQSVALTAVRLRTTRATVRLWRRRFVTEGIESLARDRAGRGRKPFPIREAIVRGASSPQGPIRSQARLLGVSPSTVARWRRARRKDGDS